MITHLTPEQEALLPLVRDEWIAHGLSAEPADRETAEAGVHATYQAAGYPSPPYLIWLSSPWAGIIGQVLCQVIFDHHSGVQMPVTNNILDAFIPFVLPTDKVHQKIRNEIYNHVIAPVRDVSLLVRDGIYSHTSQRISAIAFASIDRSQRIQEVLNQVSNETQYKIHRFLTSAAWEYGPFLEEVKSQVNAEIDVTISRKFDASLFTRLNNWHQGISWGQHSASYYSFYDALIRIGVKGLGLMAAQMTVARSAGWWWAFRDFAVITDRPAEVCRDDLGRLHSPSGLAITYRDGWGFHSWHGTQVPPEVITRSDWTLADIIRLENSEIRRACIERTGWDRLENGLRLVSSCPDPGNPGRELALYDVYLRKSTKSLSGSSL